MLTRGVALLTTALLMVVATTGAAAAAEVVVHDPRGDVWRGDYVGTPRPAPSVHVGDVRRAAFHHGPRTIVVREGFRDLRRIGSYWLYTVRIETGSHRYREVRVEADRRGWRGTARVFDRAGDRVECAVDHRIDYGRNVVRIAVPRSCLGTPARVRATASSYWAHRKRQTFFMDNPHNQQARPTGWTRWLRAA